MKIRLNIDKVTALKAGFDTYGFKIVEVSAASLTPEQREELANNLSHGYDQTPQADFYFDLNQCQGITEATPEAVVVILDQELAKKRETAALRAAREVKEKARHESQVAEWLARPIQECVTDSYRFAVFYSLKSLNDSRLDGKCKEAEALAAQLDAEYEAAQKRKKDEAEAKTAAGVVVLQHWAAAHGSELLRERLANGFEWIGLAEKEFCDQVIIRLNLGLEGAATPDGYAWDRDENRTTPTLAEIRLLKQVQKSCVDSPATAKLGWSKYVPCDPYGYHDEDDNDTPKKIARPELFITVMTPNGTEREYDFLIPKPVTADTES